MKRPLEIMLVVVVVIVAQSLAFGYGQAYRFDRMWGTDGAGNGQLGFPAGLCVDGTNLYVADTNNHRVQCFSLTGTYLSKSGGDFLPNPFAVAVDPDHNVYVTDMSTNQIEKFSATWTHLDEGGGTGTNNWEFRGLNGIAYDRIDNLLALADSGNNRMAWWTLGVYSYYTLEYRGARTLNTPRGIAYDSAGNYYIADTGNNRVERYTALTAYSCTISGLSSPYAVAVGSDNCPIIVDTGNSRIVKTNTRGTILAVYGSFGSGTGQFRFPRGVAVDAAGNVYVSDTGNNRIVRLKPDRAPTPPASLYITRGPTTLSNLTAKATGATDADGDPISYQYRWYRKGGVELTWVLTSYGGSVLPGTALALGQHWKVQARAGDGAAWSTWVESAEVVISKGLAAPMLTANAVSTAAGAAITLSLPTSAAVQVTILNLAGRTIATLPAQNLPAGTSTLAWNGRSAAGTLAPRGQYLLRVIATGDNGTRTSATSGLTR